MALAASLGILDWVLSSSTVAAKILMLKKTWWAPIFGLAIQPIWITYAWWNDQWGFIITPMCMTVIYGASVKKWIRERYEHEYVEHHLTDYVHEEFEIHTEWARRHLAEFGDDEEKEKYGGNFC